MPVKKEYLILFIIIACLTVYLVARKTDRTNYTLPVISKVKKDDITKLVVQRKENQIELNKKDDNWFIGEEGFRADNEKVKEMLLVLEGLTTTALASESESYSRYELDNDKKISVKGYQQTDLKREFDIGKTTETFRHTFVKLIGDKNIYHAEGNFRRKFELSIEELRDKSVLTFETADIKTITIKKQDSETTLQRKQPDKESPSETKDNTPKESGEKGDETGKKEATPSEEGWVTTDDKSVEKSKVESLLTDLSKLKCDKFMDVKEKENLKTPVITITLSGTKEIVLSLFSPEKDKESDHPAISSMSDYPFILASFEAERLLKLPEELLGEVKKDEKK